MRKNIDFSGVMDLVCFIPISRDLHGTDDISISWRWEIYPSVSETLFVISSLVVQCA